MPSLNGLWRKAQLKVKSCELIKENQYAQISISEGIKKQHTDMWVFRVGFFPHVKGKQFTSTLISHDCQQTHVGYD